ncbi:MAG TPA: cysteine--tRNA ligase [Nitrososphaeraceae archaeon]|nr:cysteine--tRNA ligase [Nitrososphaeraceae archaeon]
MRLYNTLTRNIEQIPHDNGIVRIYLCGVTVYDKSHIGHARVILVVDLLNRLLRDSGFKVKFVQNFTDVDDKIIKRAEEEAMSAEEIAHKYILQYQKDFGKLNIVQADRYPKATENISEMTTMIDRLLTEGHAYITINGIYFRVSSYPEYGKLSRKTVGDLVAGARVEVDRSKEHPLDFALWKFTSSKPYYTSPWGTGRPGWHIECSAMVERYLGSTIEIHCGGNDLIFPHHENEIAQSECFSNQRFAKLWFHCGMVTYHNEKMSKSLGNIITLEDALAKWGGNVVRLFCYSVHYSKPLDYREDVLAESKRIWNTIENCGWELKLGSGIHYDNKAGEIIDLSRKTLEKFKMSLENDLNSSLALKIFLEFVTQVNKMALPNGLSEELANAASKTYDKIMGLLGLKLVDISDDEIREVNAMIVRREHLRAERKYNESDKVRATLMQEYSVELMDRAEGTFWKKVERSSASL